MRAAAGRHTPTRDAATRAPSERANERANDVRVIPARERRRGAREAKGARAHGSTTAAAAGKEKKAKKARKEKRDAGDVGEPTRKKSKKTSKSGVDAVRETVAEENRIEVKVDGILSRRRSRRWS